MRKLILASLFALATLPAFAQQQLLSYDDIKYLLHNNIQHADDFLVAKGYVIKSKNDKTNNRKYGLVIAGGTTNDLAIRSDGKRLYIDLETNSLEQYNLIHESIAQYLQKNGMVADVQTYEVKDLGSIYITINDTVPYDALRKDYDIHIVANKNIMAEN